MALAYTAPSWTDGSGTGISASQLQALCDCIEGLVQGTDKAIHNISFSGSTMTFTFADGSQETAQTTVKGISSIAKTGTAGLVDTYTITYTDGTTSTFTVTNGASPTISATATADAQSSDNPTVNVTKSGTDAAPSFAFAFSGLKGAKGDTGNTGVPGADGVSPEVTITTITGGHRVNITDADHPSGQNFDVMDGASGTDSNAYHADDTAETTLDDADYVPFYDSSASGKRKSLWSNIKSVLKTYFDTLYKGASAHDAWSDVTSKPFSTVNNRLFTVENDELKPYGGQVFLNMAANTSKGTASSYQNRGVTANVRTSSMDSFGYAATLGYTMTQTATATTYTFTNTPDNTDLLIDVYSSIYGEAPTSVTTPSTTSIQVVFSTSQSRTVTLMMHKVT